MPDPGTARPLSVNFIKTRTPDPRFDFNLPDHLLPVPDQVEDFLVRDYLRGADANRVSPENTNIPTSPFAGLTFDLTPKDKDINWDALRAAVNAYAALPSDADLVPGDITEPGDGRTLIHFAQLPLGETGIFPDIVYRSIVWTAVRDSSGACYFTFSRRSTRKCLNPDGRGLYDLHEIDEGGLRRGTRHTTITSERFEELLVRARHRCAINRVQNAGL